MERYKYQDATLAWYLESEVLGLNTATDSDKNLQGF